MAAAARAASSAAPSPHENPPENPFDALAAAVAGCRVCVEAPSGRPLPHVPRPVLRLGPGTARLVIAGQAPGVRVHASGTPFDDPSGARLRDWLGLDAAAFYDAARVAIVPMGFCFPGLYAKGSDLPPRPECRHLARTRLCPAAEADAPRRARAARPGLAPAPPRPARPARAH
ncbi:uracil-DNA glycosylase family protein, partial [Nostoc sp. NIES-2111]